MDVENLELSENGNLEEWQQESFYIMSQKAHLRQLYHQVQNEHPELSGLYGKDGQGVLCANNSIERARH
jgi:hypothetical protein